KTALNDAIIAGLKQLEMGRRDKKALILISDGGDNASRHTRQEMLDLVETSLATIYAIGLDDPQDPERNPGLLRRLAHISGGEAYFPDGPSQLSSLSRSIANEMRTRYTIGYRPQTRSGTHSLRQVRVRVSAPGHARLAVRTRSRYRYEESTQP